MISDALPDAVAELADGLERRLRTLPAHHAHRATFLATYRRTTLAVGAAAARGFFEDGPWVARWTSAFGRYCIDAHDADLAGLRCRGRGGSPSN